MKAIVSMIVAVNLATALQFPEAWQSNRRMPPDIMTAPPPGSGDITPAAAETLEAELRVNPDDERAHATLASYYQSNGSRGRRFAHIMWLVEHRPESSLHSSYLRSLFLFDTPLLYDTDQYERIGREWIKQSDLHPNDSRVLFNAAQWMQYLQPEQAEKLLKRARQMNPQSRTSASRLAALYWNIIMAANGAEYSGVLVNPDLARRIERDLLQSNDALVVGITGRDLADSQLVPAVQAIAEGLLKRAQALNPQNPEWLVEPRLRIGGVIQQDPPTPRLVRKVDPVYPMLARERRIQGTVRFTAVIGKDGKVRNIRLVSGHPLLVEEAQRALEQYEYQPYSVNGVSMEVAKAVDVRFTL